MREYTISVQSKGGMHGVRVIRIAGYDWRAEPAGEVSFLMSDLAMAALDLQLRCGISDCLCGACEGPRRLSGAPNRWTVPVEWISRADRALCAELNAAVSAAEAQSQLSHA